MAKNDGGPAFACISVDPSGDVFHQTGMTLRDWFAGMAMSGTVNYPGGPAFEDAAKYAYKMADEMLKAREGEG